VPNPNPTDLKYKIQIRRVQIIAGSITFLLHSLIFCAGIEDLCARRDELHKQILEEEEEKAKLHNDIRCLTDRLAKVNESLSKKMASRAEFDRTIAETEAAYTKVYLLLLLY